MRKKKIVIIAGIALLLVVIGLYNSYKLDIYVYFANRRNNTPLPEQYESYSDINPQKIIYFGKYEMRNLFDCDRKIKYFISLKNNLIVRTNTYPKDREAEAAEGRAHGDGTSDVEEDVVRDIHYYKFDKNGNIIDSCIFKRSLDNGDELLEGDYIVNTELEYYKTWILDGDTAAKPFILQNKDLKWSAAQQISAFKKMIKEGTYGNGCVEGDNTTFYSDTPQQKFTYFVKGKWYKLFTNRLLPFDRDSCLDLMGVFADNSIEYTPEETPSYWHYFQPLYFQRTELEKIHHQGDPSTPGSGWYSLAWKGNLFCNLYIGTDTLKFKIPMAFNEMDTHTNGFVGQGEFFNAQGEKIAALKNELESYYRPYFYYTDERLNFKLFATSQYQLYIIKSVK